MKEQILQLITLILAGMIVMILHELPKSMIYKVKNSNKNTKTKKNIYKVMHYIDPIGLLLCAITQVGFSKPYMYRIKEKKTNLILGIIGLLSLCIIFLSSITLWKFTFPQHEVITYSTTKEWFIISFPNYLIQSIAIVSINMFIVNLFPISTFDIGLIIAGKSPSKYFSIIRNDYVIKSILILVILFGLINNMSSIIIQLFIVL